MSKSDLGAVTGALNAQYIPPIPIHITPTQARGARLAPGAACIISTGASRYVAAERGPGGLLVGRLGESPAQELT